MKNFLKQKEFSKILLIQESALIWIMSITFLILSFYCIQNSYLGSLPWLAAMVGFPWTAYGVSQVYYYKKSLAENTKDGIKFQTVISDMEHIASQYQDGIGLDLQEDLNYTQSNYDEFDEYQI